ncbi:hypothetical protein A8B78_19445 [Jannaschia sp. EhC01]|nr:hypothetical protein A8B78_19445 [Jannaschia sp. EhC01]
MRFGCAKSPGAARGLTPARAGASFPTSVRDVAVEIEFFWQDERGRVETMARRAHICLTVFKPEDT